MSKPRLRRKLVVRAANEIEPRVSCRAATHKPHYGISDQHDNAWQQVRRMTAHQELVGVSRANWKGVDVTSLMCSGTLRYGPHLIRDSLKKQWA